MQSRAAQRLLPVTAFAGGWSCVPSLLRPSCRPQSLGPPCWSLQAAGGSWFGVGVEMRAFGGWDFSPVLMVSEPGTQAPAGPGGCRGQGRKHPFPMELPGPCSSLSPELGWSLRRTPGTGSPGQMDRALRPESSGTVSPSGYGPASADGLSGAGFWLVGGPAPRV